MLFVNFDTKLFCPFSCGEEKLDRMIKTKKSFILTKFLVDSHTKVVGPLNKSPCAMVAYLSLIFVVSWVITEERGTLEVWIPTNFFLHDARLDSRPN